MIASLALFVFVSAPVAAAGSESTGAAAVGLRFTEEIPQHERLSLRETFEQMLPRACQPPPCTEDCPDDVATIGLVIGGRSRDYTLHWELNAPALDGPLTTDSTCELCSLDEFEEQFATDLHALCSRLDWGQTAPGQLQVSSDPGGARLRIDGRALARARTPWVGELDAGEHQIEVYAPGYVRQQRTIAIVASVSERQHFTLIPSVASTQRRRSWPGWTSATLGIAMGVAGSVLIALDNKPWAGRCSGRNIDANGNCQFVYATLPLGIGLSVAGTVAVATGFGVVVWAQRGDAGHSNAGLALHGRF